MEAEHKIAMLGEAAKYDICRECGGPHSDRVLDDIGRWIYPAVRPDGQRIRMLKVLQTNVCENDCAYCTNRAGHDVPRASFTPDELARMFDELVRRGRAQALFLSSGIYGSVAHASERMLATVELVRKRYGFRGYVHLKILPGADDGIIEHALHLVDRVSVNLEAPNAKRVRMLSQCKNLEVDLLGPLVAARKLLQQTGRDVSMTTQFVVGAADESDRELLATTSALYSQLRLARVYYSAFQPVEGTPLEQHAPTPAWREHRLYQADFLLRQYGYRYPELVFEGDNLPREADPKLLWALHHPDEFPVEVNTAAREQLLRIPGFGPRTVSRILSLRHSGRIADLHDLDRLGACSQRAGPFVLLGGKRPPFQLPLL